MVRGEIYAVTAQFMPINTLNQPFAARTQPRAARVGRLLRDDAGLVQLLAHRNRA
jgi:hypothetical protein